MTNQPLDELIAERDRLLDAARRSYNLAKELEPQIADAKRVQLKRFLGKPVKYTGHVDSGNRWMWIRKRTGILLKVSRKRCDVDYNGHIVTMPFLDVTPADLNEDTQSANQRVNAS